MTNNAIFSRVISIVLSVMIFVSTPAQAFVASGAVYVPNVSAIVDEQVGLPELEGAGEDAYAENDGYDDPEDGAQDDATGNVPNDISDEQYGTEPDYPTYTDGQNDANEPTIVGFHPLMGEYEEPLEVDFGRTFASLTAQEELLPRLYPLVESGGSLSLIEFYDSYLGRNVPFSIQLQWGAPTFEDGRVTGIHAIEAVNILQTLEDAIEELYYLTGRHYELNESSWEWLGVEFDDE